MKLIKKADKLLIQNTKTTAESIESHFQADTINSLELTVEEQLELDVEYEEEPNYNPVVLSVGNTGWQVSDIWKDIRLDNF
ncbi:hypothetical protein [Cylindrospermum sp. FACHB-282]|uniref:hypothetical protein n=1 Tax=Cylindrospermum sp. FACHB-282 TaxID=2692794 RepID=UPI001683CF40|nr:hypothetical protein [Cylindrospermum sp. FACHB-282]MBD2386878.1 hypothetical protein [Cylindrospermum sp. FACHB-282]